MSERLPVPNPFESDVVTDPARPAPADVSVIHHQALERCRAAYERVATKAESRSVLLYGEAGCGKTHLLSRFRIWLGGGEEAAPSVSPALFVAVRMETGPGYIWRHLRRRFAEELVQRRGNGAAPLDAIVNRFAAECGGALEEAFDRSPIPDLGLDLIRVMEHFAAGRHRRLCRSWLAGDALTEEDYRVLNVAPPAAEALDEDVAEFDARRVVLAITRLCAPRPVVFCFDQIEALGLAQQNKSYGAFSRMGASLIDTTKNVLMVSTVLATFLQALQDGSVFADFQRFTKEMMDLQPLDWDLGRRLIEARLALVPELAGANPIRDSDLRAFYQSQHERCTPRRLIHEARRLFNQWQDRPEPPRQSEPAFLAAQFERLWSESPARSDPAETGSVLAHGVPILLQLLGHSTQDRPARSIDLGTNSGRAKLWLAYGNQADMRSFSHWLRRVSEDSGGAKLCVVRDARLPVSTGAKTARERLEKIVQEGGKVVRVEAEAVAALDAMRRLLSETTSGDLSLNGDSIASETVREWLAANLPRGLTRFSDELLGKQAGGPGETPDALLELLRGRKVIPLEEAIRISNVPRERIEDYANTHPDRILMFGGAYPVVCQAVVAPAKRGADGPA